MNWTHRHARINGIHVHYVEQGQGLPVVLCHGFPHLWFSWHRQITALAGAGYRVIAPDMRGMGQTEAPPEVEAYDIDHITGDLLGLLDHIGELDTSKRIRTAVEAVVAEGKVRTYDMLRMTGSQKVVEQGACTTQQMTDAVIAKL